MLKVFAIGSCRLFRPLRRLHAAGKIDLTNIDGPNWFVHCAPAARQFVEIAAGLRAFPDELDDLIAENAHHGERDGREKLAATDILAIEVSSLKVYTTSDGWVINQHLMHSPRLPEGDPRPKAAAYSRATAASIANELRAIQSMTGRAIVTTDHLYYLDEGGQELAGRPEVTAALREASEAAVCHFMPTRDLLDGRPQQKTLADSNHYHKDFEAAVGEWMLSHLSSAAT